MQFEYQTVSRRSPMHRDELNSWGRRGWELVSVNGGGNSYTPIQFYFKRRVQ